MKTSKLLSTLLSTSFILSTLTMPVMATTNTNASNTQVTVDIEGDGPSISDKDGPLVDGNLVSITVPSVLPFIFNKNGTTTTPTNWQVKNYDTSDIVLASIYFKPHDDWDIHKVETKPGEYLLDKGHDYKTIEVYVGEQGKDNLVSIGKTSQDSQTDIKIKGVKEINSYNAATLEFKVYRTPFTYAAEIYSAYTMHIDFAFKESNNTIDRNTFQEETRLMKSISFDGYNKDIFSNEESIDLSSEQDGSVMGLDLGDGEYHVASNDIIYAPIDSSYLFSDYPELKSIDFSNNFNTSKTTNMEGMFSNLPKLTTINLGNNFGQDYNIPETGLFHLDNRQTLTVLNANDIMRKYDYESDNRDVFFIPPEIKDGTLSKERLKSTLSTLMRNNTIYNVYFDDITGDLSIFTNSNAIDLSEEQDGSIMGLLDEYDSNSFHIICTGTIYAPEDSSELFNFVEGSWSSLMLLDLTNFDTSKVTNASGMFAHCTSLEQLDLSKFDTSHITDMSRMFYGCYYLSSINMNNWDTSNVTTMANMFYQVGYIKGLVDLDVSMINTSKVSDMSNMFAYCQSLKSIDLSTFDTSSLTNMSSMFENCVTIESIIFGNNFDTFKVNNMSKLFWHCEKLPIVDVSMFNTSNVVGTGMRYLFRGCYNLTEIDISMFDTTKVNNFQDMFYDCQSLSSIKYSDTFVNSNITIITNLFYNCQSLESIDVSKFNTSNVTSMFGIFSGCSKLTSIDISNFNTSKVTNMRGMFENCINVKSINLGSNFVTTNVTTMAYMFNNCESLLSIDLSNFNTSKVTSMTKMFNNCASLIKLDLSTFNLLTLSNSTGPVTGETGSVKGCDLYKFAAGCDKLTTIILNDNFTTSWINSYTLYLFYVNTSTKTKVTGLSTRMQSYNWTRDNRVLI